MNQIPPVPSSTLNPPCPGRLRVWPFLLGGAALFILLATVVLIKLFWNSSDLRRLRSPLLEASGAAWDKKIGFNAGPILLSAVRAGASFAPLDPDAQAALRAVRGGEFIYYQQDGQSRTPPDYAAMMEAADKKMSKGGWERIVSVINDDTLVLVFTPSDMKSINDVRVCVAVLAGRDFIFVSGRADLAPITEIARRHLPGHLGRMKKETGQKDAFSENSGDAAALNYGIAWNF